MLRGFLCLNTRNRGGDCGFAWIVVGGRRPFVLLCRFSCFGTGDGRFNGGFTRIDRRVGFCGWRLLRRFAGFSTGNRCLYGRFARVDRILLDAPCTGTGTVISGNEKSLRGLTEQLLSKCARSQRALLDRAMGALKPGGTLVYSTCSIMPQENEDALQEALDKHMDCELIPLDGTPSESEARRAQEAGEEPRVESNALTEAIAAGQVSAIANGLPGTLTIPPSRDFEGFYIALIRKRS